MHKNDQDQKATKAETLGADVDLTAVFRKGGLTQTVSASPAFEAKYRVLAHTVDGTDHYDIIWGVRCAVTGCLPTRSLASPRGKALLLQLPSFQGGACERDVEIVIEFPCPEHLALRLPEEFDEWIVPRVLLAEEDEELSRLLDLLLSREGFEITVTWSGAAATSLAQERRFDLLLLDVDLPDIDGFTLCSRLRADPITASLPVVICCAWHGLGALAVRAGAVGYCQKPLDLTHLPSRLRHLLGDSPPANKSNSKLNTATRETQTPSK